MNNFTLRVLKKLNLLERFNLEGTVVLNGKEFNVPVMGHVGYSNIFMTEPWMIELLKMIISIDKNKFVDVGVNIGQTILKLRSVSDEIQYLGFEPNPVCNQYVDRLISRNNMKNTEVVPVGVSTSTEVGKLVFYTKGETDSSASIIRDFRPGQEIDHVTYVPIFDIAELKDHVEIGDISILKIDVEGAELEVLKSFENDIRASNPIILIEILPVYKKENHVRLERQDQIQQLFNSMEYSMYRILKDGIKISELQRVQDIGIHSTVEYCDYVVVPGTKVKAFETKCVEHSVGLV